MSHSSNFRQKTSKKLRSLITFIPRKSHFESSSAHEFRGFFSLFWISMALLMVRTYVVSIESTGSPLNLVFARAISRDAIVLAITDVVLVLSTVAAVPFAKAVSKGWLNHHGLGMVVQHAFQTIHLFLAVTWTYHREWPWVQSGFLTLHSLVMIMKMHSWATINGGLRDVLDQSKQLLRELVDATERVGGMDQAMRDAKVHRMEMDLKSGGTNTPSMASDTSPETDFIEPADTAKAYVDPATATALRKRLTEVTEESNTHIEPPGSELKKESSPEATVLRSGPPAPHPLVDHPDAEIAELAAEYTELKGELTSAGPNYVTWPENITYHDYAVYMLIPTLCYELEYPRTERVRPLYVFEKTVATFGTFALLYTVTESFILPLMPNTQNQSFLRSLLDLSLPFMIAYLLLFFIIFECICPGFAELSCFADRQFYEDWWNSTSWDEFSRKWNKPVHAFLLRHVYAATISSFGISRTTAMFVTFLLSACAHELVMAVATQKFRMYLFLLQLVQLPLIAMGRLPIIKRNKLMGNIVFWLGLYTGFPLLCVAYVAY